MIFISDKTGKEFYDFKVLAAAVEVGNKMKELNMSNDAYNSAEEVSYCIK